MFVFRAAVSRLLPMMALMGLGQEIHTHYDPQICWDRLATPSIEHGCTSVVMGNCSLSVAPVRDKKASDKLVL